ncbi:hypothetical protein Ait01nite_029390 [Actinoplanes italicus]|uniref:Uncharacterized protein n=1 Tax=Actinoplanes italicus TaxID=113567 RepID=A0A2T0KIQ4_9ACTN|nr:hypothetical protein [Actinoplanes italicus]PRX23394.1 hypothetical protein CLV67_103141 [Actinoplanes italicus]GIE29894.1 hypothetical protein Ait01nite_029390 [Actinoplanes italicus]
MYTEQWPSYSPGAYEQAWTDSAYGTAGQYDHGYSTITVTARYFPLAFLLALVKPVLIIDGQPVRIGWNEPVVVPVTPGQHHVHVHTPYLLPRRMGKADLVVTAHPGRSVDLEYKSPLVVNARGALGSPPQKYPGMAAFIILMVLTLVLALCSAASTFSSLGLLSARQTAGSTATPAPSEDGVVPALPPLPTDGPGLPTSVPDRTRPAEAAGRPELRTGVPARRLAGPSFTAGDETTTKAFTGWPFAFRTPDGWDCRPQNDKRVADAKLYGCSDPNAGNGRGLIVVMLRPCPSGCGTAVQSALNGFWFAPTDRLRREDATTVFTESARGTTTGGYELYLSHFFVAGGRSGEPEWQVAVAAVAKSKDGRAQAQKVLNDILSQTS